MKHQKYITYGLLILMSMSGLIATDIYLPSLPAIAQYLNTSKAMVQTTITIFLFTFGLSQLISGTISDKFGRKPILIIGYVIFIFGSIVTIFSHSITFLILGRAIQGLGIGAGTALSRILVRDLFEGLHLRKMMASLASCIALAPALAPVAGGYIQQHLGFRYNFVFLLVYGIMMLILLLLFLQETNRYKMQKLTVISNYRYLLSHKVFVGNVLIAGLSFAVIIAFAIINPFIIITELGLSPVMFSYITLVGASGLGIGNMVNRKLVEKFDGHKMNQLGLLLVTAAGILMLGLHALHDMTWYDLMLVSLMAATGVGIVFPSVSTNAFMPFPKIAGSAGALYGSIQIVTTAIASYLIVQLPSQSAVTLAIILLVLGIAGILINRLISTQNIKKTDELPIAR